MAYIYLVSVVVAAPVPENRPLEQRWDQNSIKYQVVVPVPLKQQIKGIVSYFNADPNQTDSSPCFTADGTEICNTDENIASANWLPFGTRIQVDGKVYRVADRMNKRYGFPYVDILVKTKAQARKLGRQKKVIKILN